MLCGLMNIITNPLTLIIALDCIIRLGLRKLLNHAVEYCLLFDCAMSKYDFIFSILLFILLTSFSIGKNESITDADYLREDSLLWCDYVRGVNAINNLIEIHPEKSDSLKQILPLLYYKASIKNVALALEYFDTPNGLKRVYMVRNSVGKSTLNDILKALPKTLKNNPYAVSICNYVETRQLVEGDKYITFDCQTASGKQFDWESLSHKNVLLLYDGLMCMGESGRDYLKELLNKTDRKDFEIVVFCLTSSLENLKNLQNLYPDFILISDFQIDGNPMNIIYNAQSTPTCFMISREGIIKVISVGLNPDRFETHLTSDGCLK